MLILLSPAKKLASTAPKINLESTPLAFKKETLSLVKVLQNYSQEKLGELMGLSEKLAKLNFERYQGFNLSKSKTLPALFIFQGDVYQTLKAAEFNEKELIFAGEHLRILSGLYGLLEPENRIAPYRLEMGTSLTTESGSNLYDYWGEKIAATLNQQLSTHKNKTIINLASNEYSKAVSKKTLQHPMIDVAFKEYKNGAYKTIGILAKRARGAFARFMITEGIDHPSDLKHFNAFGYQFNEERSNANTLTFIGKS